MSDDELPVDLEFGKKIQPLIDYATQHDELEPCPDCDASDMGERCPKCRASAVNKPSIEDALRAEISSWKDEYSEVESNLAQSIASVNELNMSCKELTEQLAEAQRANLEQRVEAVMYRWYTRISEPAQYLQLWITDTFGLTLHNPARYFNYQAGHFYKDKLAEWLIGQGVTG